MSRSSGSSMDAMRRTILLEIEKLNDKINYISKLKDEAIDNLKQQKIQFADHEILGENDAFDPFDDEIMRIKRRHTDVMMRQSKIHVAHEEYEKLEDDAMRISKELEEIQERHENAMKHLNEKRNYLQERLESFEGLAVLEGKTEGAIQEEMDMYAENVIRLKLEREALLKRTDMSPSEMELALQNIDNQLEELEARHILNMNKLSSTYSQLQEEISQTFSPSRRDEIMKELEQLKLKSINATPSELIIIEKRMEELQTELQNMQMLIDIQEEAVQAKLATALERRGLHMTPSGNLVTDSGRKMTMQEAKEAGLLEGVDDEMTRERERETLNQFLEERGLKLTPSGRIQTQTGEVLTFEEAKKLGLLRGIDEELMKLRGISLTASGRILTKDGKVLSRAEAERLGLLDDINLDEIYAVESESISVSSSTVTSLSGMSSSDVHYLKNVLGRPLALGLAEVTAKQPRDPIHYLGHWLYKYRYNQEIDEVKKKEVADLLEERDRLATIALREQAELGAKEVLIDLLGRVDQEVTRNAIESELRRIESEAAAIEAEEAALESEARDTLGVYNGPTKGQQLL